MTMITCEHCDTRVVITSSGICPSCRKKVTNVAIPPKPVARPVVEHIAVETPPQQQPIVRAPNPKFCDYCGKDGPDIKRACLTLARIPEWTVMFPIAMLFATKRLFVDCWACDTCVGESKRTVRTVVMLALAGFGWPFLFLAAIIAINSYLGRVGGAERSPLVGPIFAWALVGLFFAGPLISLVTILRYKKRRTSELLGAVHGPPLFQRIGSNSLGLGSMTLARRCPRNTSPVKLDDISPVQLVPMN